MKGSRRPSGLEERRGNIECPEYVPVREELHALARYWAWVMVDAELRRLCDGSPDPREDCAATRLAKILDTIGEIAVDEAFADVKKERERIGEADRRTRTKGTSEEREAVPASMHGDGNGKPRN